jgi:hypothetical protein
VDSPLVRRAHTRQRRPRTDPHAALPVAGRTGIVAEAAAESRSPRRGQSLARRPLSHRRDAPVCFSSAGRDRRPPSFGGPSRSGSRRR